MAEFDEDIAGISFMVSKENRVFVLDDSGLRYLDRDDVLKLADFAAAAYEALEGEPYVHAEYDKGLVAIVKEGEHVIPKRAAVLPLFLDKMDSVHDDGNGLERDCE